MLLVNTHQDHSPIRFDIGGPTARPQELELVRKSVAPPSASPIAHPRRKGIPAADLSG